MARTLGMDCWWVTTLLLKAAKTDAIDASEANAVLYDLVDAGMNLHPAIFSRIQRELEGFEP